MLRSTLSVSFLALLCVAFAGPLQALPVVINNGLAPPNPANVIDDGTHASDDVHVRNVGCPPGWPAVPPDDPCPSPGAATEVEIASGGVVDMLFAYEPSTVTLSGGSVESHLVTYDSSAATVNGGSVGFLALIYDSSTIDISDGTVRRLELSDSSAVTMSGGVIETTLKGFDSSTITMTGGSVLTTLQAFGPALTWSGGSVNNLTVSGSAIATLLNDRQLGGWLSVGSNATLDMSGGSVGRHMWTQGSSVSVLNDVVVAEYLSAEDSSAVTLNDVVVGDDLAAYESSVVKMQGASVENGNLLAYHLSTIVMSGGVVSLGSLQAYDSSTIVLIGSNFMVDTGSGPIPVPYGDLNALTGTLTGTLASGDSLNNVFYQGGYGGSVTGTITLSPGAECNDGIDNDGDGLTDFDGGQSIWGECSGQPGGCPANVSDPDGDGVANPDPDCESFVDPSEEPTCDDGIDNDGDTFVDYPDDPGCRDAASDIEDPQCQDGINNDHWSGQDPNPGLIDFDGGQSIWGVCTGVPGGCPANVSDPEGDGVANPDPQCVGKPWKNAERKSSSYPCGLGVELVLLLPPLMWLSWRRRRSLH